MKWCLAALAATGATVAAVVVWLDGAGYCFPERRFLSDAEKITAAANYARRGFPVTFLVRRADGTAADMGDRTAASISVETPAYGSTAEFLAANPGCCRMAGPGAPADLRHPEWADERRHRRPERSVVVIDMTVPFALPIGERRTATFRTNIGLWPCGHVEPRRLFKRVARLTSSVAFVERPIKAGTTRS
jgi:hypothetical protein